MLHYFAQRFFSPTLISPYKDGGGLDVYIVMDEVPIKELRLPTDYKLHFQPKSNPRPFHRPNSNSQHSTSHTVYRTSTADFTGNLYIEMYSWNNMSPLHVWVTPFEVCIESCI